MLKDFFKLNGTVKSYVESDVVSHFQTSADLQNVLYKPDDWPTQLKGNSKFSFKNVSFSKTTFTNVTFRDCIFEDCLFIGARFNGVEFHNCRFKNCNFYKATIESCYLDPKSIKFDKTYKKNAANIGVTLFQKLLENSSQERQPFFEIDADIRFRQWKRAQLLYDVRKKKIGRFQFVLSFIRNAAYEGICGFGYRPVRFAIWTIGLFIVIAAVNVWAFRDGLTVNGNPISSPDFVDSVYFTFSILTVLGFSSIFPVTSFAKMVTVLEALLGVGWMGMFTSVLVKRFLK